MSGRGQIICQCKLQLCCLVKQMQKFLLRGKLNNSTTKVGTSDGQLSSVQFNIQIRPASQLYYLLFGFLSEKARQRTLALVGR